MKHALPATLFALQVTIVAQAQSHVPPTTGDDWTSYGFTPGETRYSLLNQIHTTNVSRLGLA